MRYISVPKNAYNLHCSVLGVQSRVRKYGLIIANVNYVIWRPLRPPGVCKTRKGLIVRPESQIWPCVVCVLLRMTFKMIGGERPSKVFGFGIFRSSPELIPVAMLPLSAVGLGVIYILYGLMTKPDVVINKKHDLPPWERVDPEKTTKASNENCPRIQASSRARPTEEGNRRPINVRKLT
ncbi:hypothetical protein LSH36_446g02029 [Paralvinella palmiformis]|uniref:Uncharacterized protein n=1 Tax=Paralvinella palmiformis TaxID=53620 RepID=A0AAD9JAE3_9ANNE|nr:hypothetical protein LSH36_446g02029 [Paralvinella palmiformis]